MTAPPATPPRLPDGLPTPTWKQDGPLFATHEPAQMEIGGTGE